MLVVVMLAASTLAANQAQAAPADADRAILADLMRQIERLAALTFPSTQETEEFEAHISQLSELFPSEPVSYLWAGQWAERQFEPEKAQHFWREALKKQSRLQVKEDKLVWAQCCQLLGEQALGEGDPAAAQEYAEKALEYQPADPRSLRLLMDAGFRTGRINEAVAAILAAYEKHREQNLEIALLYYDLLADMGRWDELKGLLEAEPKERDRQLHLYRSRLAELQNDALGAFCHLLLGFWNGDLDRGVCQECKTRLDRYLRVEVESIAEPIRTLVRGYHAMERNDEAEAVLVDLLAVEPASAEHRLVRDWLIASLQANLGKLEPAAERLAQIRQENPFFVPAVVLQGDVLQARGDQPEAAKLFEEARRQAATNWKVVEMDRMGASFELIEEGVRVAAVQEDGYWHRFGVRAGDVVVRLDQKELFALPPFERLRIVRLFQGGTVTYRTKAGELLEREMDLVLFGF